MGKGAPGGRSKLNRRPGSQYGKAAIRVWRPTDWGKIDCGTHPARRSLKSMPVPETIGRAERDIDRCQAKGMDGVGLYCCLVAGGQTEE